MIANGTPASGPSAAILGGGQRLVGHRDAERVELRVEFLDPPQAQLDELAGAELPGADVRGERGRAGEDRSRLGASWLIPAERLTSAARAPARSDRRGYAVRIPP